MNKFEILKSMMTKGMTPKGLVMNMAGNNPIVKNLIEMAEVDITDMIILTI